MDKRKKILSLFSLVCGEDAGAWYSGDRFAAAGIVEGHFFTTLAHMSLPKMISKIAGQKYQYAIPRPILKEFKSC